MACIHIRGNIIRIFVRGNVTRYSDFAIHSAEVQGHSHLVESVAWIPDGSQLASASDDKTVRIWDASTGQEVSKLLGHSSFVTSVAWSSPNVVGRPIGRSSTWLTI